jgi:tripartite-type tricarboxylate transporter receptor subunit TctC
MSKRLALAAFSAVIAAVPINAASAYPTKPITMILGFAPGGPSDVMARVLSKKMEEFLKQPIIIENKAGAGGTIAGNLVARAAPDGHTIMLASGSILAINVTLYKNVQYDSIKDYAPISMLGVQTNVLYTHPSIPANNLKEFIAYAKANPGKLSFGSGGVGTPAHLAGELLRIKAGIQYTHVPFKGSGPTLQSVIGNHVPTAFNPPAPLITRDSTPPPGMPWLRLPARRRRSSWRSTRLSSARSKTRWYERRSPTVASM